MKRMIIATLVLMLSACASRPIIQTTKDVKVSREEPGSDCKPMGKLTGTTLTARGTQEQALEDLKREAANKGANYVVVKQFSDYGTSVTGVAYECP